MKEKKESGKDNWIDRLYSYYMKTISSLPPGFDEISNKITAEEENLEQYVSQPGWDVYQVIGDLLEERHLIENQEAFRVGFSFGAGLIQEALSHPDREKILSYALENPPDIE